MKRFRPLRIIVVSLALAALVTPLAALGGPGGGAGPQRPEPRTFFATDTAGNLLRFNAVAPRVAFSKPITGLPAGVTLRGLDFRPATGDLYSIGSDRVVYRVNPFTAIAVAEAPSFDAGGAILAGASFGFDFNPTVDKIRITSDADSNLRLDPDSGALVGGAADAPLNPADVTVVGSAYTNSSFTATKPTATMLFALDVSSAPDRLFTQAPPNNGTLINPVSLGFDLGTDAGFDIAGAANVGWVAGTPAGKTHAELFMVDVVTGATRSRGRIGLRPTTITGLAAWQDQ